MDVLHDLRDVDNLGLLDPVALLNVSSLCGTMVMVDVVSLVLFAVSVVMNTVTLGFSLSSLVSAFVSAGNSLLSSVFLESDSFLLLSHALGSDLDDSLFSDLGGSSSALSEHSGFLNASGTKVSGGSSKLGLVKHFLLDLFGLFNEVGSSSLHSVLNVVSVLSSFLGFPSSLLNSSISNFGGSSELGHGSGFLFFGFGHCSSLHSLGLVLDVHQVFNSFLLCVFDVSAGTIEFSLRSSENVSLGSLSCGHSTSSNAVSTVSDTLCSLKLGGKDSSGISSGFGVSPGIHINVSIATVEVSSAGLVVVVGVADNLGLLLVPVRLLNPLISGSLGALVIMVVAMAVLNIGVPLVDHSSGPSGVVLVPGLRQDNLFVGDGVSLSSVHNLLGLVDDGLGLHMLDGLHVFDYVGHGGLSGHGNNC